MNQINIKRLTSSAQIPTKQTENSAGYDLYSDEEVVLPAHGFRGVSTGIAMELPSNMEAQVRPRSGLAFKNGITVLNAPGTIDADYRGEVKVALINHSDKDYTINKGDRIAQLIFALIPETTLTEVSDLSDSARGTGGFGSTGR